MTKKKLAIIDGLGTQIDATDQQLRDLRTENAALREVAAAARVFVREAPQSGDYAILLLALKSQALDEDEQGWVTAYSEARHKLTEALQSAREKARTTHPTPDSREATPERGGCKGLPC